MRKRVSSAKEETSCGSGAGAALAMSICIVGRFCEESTPEDERSVENLAKIREGTGSSCEVRPCFVALRLLFAMVGTFALAGAPFFQALSETDGRADEVEFLAKLIFEETLIAEMQRLKLVGE